MTFVVTEPCVGTKDRSCVEVCPVDCFYNYNNKELNKKVGSEPSKQGDYGMLVIHPDQCTLCGACEPECPVEAIFEDSDIPEKWVEYTALNANVAHGYSPGELDSHRVTSKG